MAKWACNAHKIRKIRHLRGTKARSEKISAIGVIREHNNILMYGKTKTYEKTQALNATSNGGDASRVGKIAMFIH